MCKRVWLTAKEVEMEMQEARNADGFAGKMETDYISRMMKDAKRNGMIGDKLQLVVDPMYIHVPEWQRRLRLSKAYSIGNSYNKYKWDVPKVLFYKGKLWVIDGQHRIYGAFKAKMDAVVVEIMECSLEEAIDLFINQSQDRAKMQPMDIYKAAVAAGKTDYIKLQEICHKNNVAVKGEDSTENVVGTLTSISDGINLARYNPNLLDSMLRLLGKLEWNGYADTYNGKAYTAKIVRVLKMLYAYCEGRTDEMEEALIKDCKGTEFFVKNIMNKSQAQIFDYLSDIVRYEMESPFTEEKRKTNALKKATKTANVKAI